MNNKLKEKYLSAFIIAFAACVIAFLPIIIMNGGSFFYYGDYNKQQIVFYTRLHDAVRSGTLSSWDFLADLGSDTVSAYSFYLLGSPFFWLSTIFPSSAILITMPLLIALKSGIASVGAYALSRRFCQNRTACLTAGILFGLSAYNSANILFNHFHDAVLLLPFMLLALENLVNDGKHGFFAVTVALSAFTSYYFFFGQVIFIALYFFISVFSGHFRLTKTRFAALAFESIVGTLCAAVLLLPSSAAVINNPRVTEMLSGSALIIHTPASNYFHILRNLLLLPDITLVNNFGVTPAQTAGCFASYIPFFSLAGVIAYFRTVKGRDHLKLIMAACGVFALIPVLNQSFSFFNAMFYGRWFYMPTLIAAVMTARTLELSAGDKLVLRKGFIPSAVLTAIMALTCIILTFLASGDTVSLKFENTAYAYSQALFAIAAAAFLGMTLYDKKLSADAVIKQLSVRAAVFASLGMCTVVWCSFIFRGTSETDKMTSAWELRTDTPTALTQSATFSRTAAEANYQNMPVLWGMPTTRYFNSTVEPTITEFYNAAGLERTVKSDFEPTYYPLMELLSVRFYADGAYFDNNGDPRPPAEYLTGTADTYKFITRQSDVNFYENTEFLPMGFAFDTYTTADALKNEEPLMRSFALLDSVLLSEEQISTYKDILQEYDTDLIKTAPERYKDTVNKLRTRSCSSFKTDTDSFEAEITLDKTALVFFSVPYSEYWQAEVNGREAKVEKVDGGLMAVLCEKGENTITFTYKNKMLTIGLIISISAAIMLMIYITLCEVKKNKKQEE